MKNAAHYFALKQVSAVAPRCNGICVKGEEKDNEIKHCYKKKKNSRLISTPAIKGFYSSLQGGYC